MTSFRTKLKFPEEMYEINTEAILNNRQSIRLQSLPNLHSNNQTFPLENLLKDE
jgi:hypothetical protein